MRKALGVAGIVIVALTSSCTRDGSGDAADAGDAIVTALDDMQDGKADDAWATLHPDEQRRTNTASFAECVASQGLSPDAQRSEHRVKAVHDEDDPEVAGHTIMGDAQRVTIEFWTSEAEIRGGGPQLDFYAFRVGPTWRWADPHLDVANCARLPIE
jgi:hypothetical protein